MPPLGNYIRIGSWNIHGFSQKRKDPELINKILAHDFIAFLETWTTPQSNTNMPIPYKAIHRLGTKRKPRAVHPEESCFCIRKNMHLTSQKSNTE